MKKRNIAVVMVLFVIAVAGYLLADWYQAKPVNVEAHYVGRQSCIECHQKEAGLFHGSDHDLAMDVATDQTVLADFSDRELTHHGLTSRMFRDGEKFMVHTEGPTGEMQDFEVKYVFGVRPLQQYMVEIDRPADASTDEIGRVQVLRLSWDTNANEWFYLNPPDVDEKLDPDDPLHWTGITQNWNASCASCHSTDLKKNFDSLANEYHTTFSEIDVSCEACHGPGSLHVELAREGGLFWDRNHAYGLVKLKTTSNLPQVESCAPCHARRSVLDKDYQPGCSFDDYFAAQLLTEPTYHADGQIRDEDYVYGSFIQSKMFHNGIRCTDCHDPHSTKVKFDNNLLCTSCHQHPSGKYDTPNHHHHQPGTPGASCIECHMPATTYMAIDSRRDHSFRVPRPDLSVKLGTPNACTACHIDASKLTANPERKLTQYLDWILLAEAGDQEIESELARVNEQMLTATKQWYPVGQSPPMSEYYEQLAIGQSEQKESVPTLNRLARDSKAPAIVRATAMAVLADDPAEESLATAMAALADPDPKVASAAISRIDMEIRRVVDRNRYGNVSGDDRKQLKTLIVGIASLLATDSRRLRIEAARSLVGIPAEYRQSCLDPDLGQAFELALDDYKRSLYVENDRAGNHMMLGGLHEMLGDRERAKEDYRAAITVEPNLAGPRSNLAAILESDYERLQNQLRQTQSGGGMAAGQLKGIVAQMQNLNQQSSRLRGQDHGLLAKEIQRNEGVAGSHGLHYRFAMSSYIQHDLAATEKHLLEAIAQQPDDAMYLMGLATYYLQVEAPEKAKDYIDQLIQQDPNHPGYQALLQQAQQQLQIKRQAPDSDVDSN